MSTPLRNIMTKHICEPAYFGFVSVDIEGGEFEALQSLDCDKIAFGIILIESVIDMLRGKEYDGASIFY